MTLDWTPFIDAGANVTNTAAIVGFPQLDGTSRPILSEGLSIHSATQSTALLGLGQHWQAQVEEYSIVPRGPGFLDILGIAGVSTSREAVDVKLLKYLRQNQMIRVYNPLSKSAPRL